MFSHHPHPQTLNLLLSLYLAAIGFMAQKKKPANRSSEASYTCSKPPDRASM